MEVVRLLTGALSNDHDRRVIGRMLFVTLDDFVKISPEVKNVLRAEGKDVTRLTGLIRDLTSDFENSFVPIRDHLTAHLHDDVVGATPVSPAQAMIDRLDLWNLMDWSSVSILLTMHGR